MPSLVDDDETVAWPSFNPVENGSNFVNVNANVIRENAVDEPAEARAWSTYQDANSENVLSEGPRREDFSSKLLSKHDKKKEDIRGVEQILCYIDRHRSPHKKRYRLTWRTFFGTMSGMEQIYGQDNFLRDYEELRPVFIFMDSVFRGISQVMFANNPLSGIIITIGLFIGNWELALYGLLGTSVSTLTAHILGFNYNSIRAGLYGYNGCLTGMGISYFSFSHSPQMIGPVIIMSIFSTIFVMSISKILVQRLQLSPFTFSFQICTWIWLLGSLKYRYFFVNGTILSPELLITMINKPDLSNISYSTYSVQDNFVGFFASVAQVYFISNPYTGAIILVGVCICSRILSFFALFGAVTGQLTAAYLLGLPATSIHAGLWGFNSVLTCQALGGMFFVLYGYRIWIFTLYASIMTVLVESTVSSFLSPVGMPTLTFPFTVICWIFCLIAGSKNLIAVKLTAVSIPEDHYRRFRLSQLVKAQFKYLNDITHFSSGYNEDITWEELSKIKEIFVPILMCSHAYNNDINSMKILIKQKINIHSTDQNSRSPLHISASQGNIKITKWLVEDLKLNVNLIDKFGGTPLYDAFSNGHFYLLPFLYSHGARFPASKSRELAFYLNAFVYEANLEAIQSLLSCGFNPNASDFDGRNSLHMAVITNQLKIVRYLVEQFPIWLDIKDYFHKTAIDYALRLPDLSIANYLLYKRDNNYMPLNISTDKSPLLQIVVERSLENKKNLNEAKKDEESSININENLFPALFSMISSEEDIKVMTNFLKEYSNLNIFKCVDYDFRSALHVAAAKGQFETIRFLSEQCSNSDFARAMNREDRWGLSPLDEASRNGHFHICHFVNQHINDQNISHTTEITLEDNLTIRLLRKWKKVFLFCTLSASGAAERIDGLFARHYFLRTELYADYHGRTPMYFAAANGHLNVVQLLIKYGYQDATHIDGQIIKFIKQN
jgi:urea transporter